MKYFVFFLPLILLVGCAKFPKYQTPFSVEDPSIKGDKLFANGIMISSTQKRYWYSYRYALERGGYTVEADASFPFFKTTGAYSADRR